MPRLRIGKFLGVLLELWSLGRWEGAPNAQTFPFLTAGNLVLRKTCSFTVNHDIVIYIVCSAPRLPKS